MSDELKVQIERTYDAPADRVFQAWITPEVMRRWWQAEIRFETSEAEVDPRVGGAVRVVMRDPEKGEDYGGGGHYTEFDPPSRLAFTWVWDFDGRETLIEIDFEQNDGATTVRFTHNGLINEASVRNHEGGWGQILDNLGRDLEQPSRE